MKIIIYWYFLLKNIIELVKLIFVQVFSRKIPVIELVIENGGREAARRVLRGDTDFYLLMKNISLYVPAFKLKKFFKENLPMYVINYILEIFLIS